MADLLALSARIIDEGLTDEPSNRITQELSEVAEGIAVVESFSHCVAHRTGEGLVVFDASGPGTAPQVVESLRRWNREEVHSLVYTHGHLDHVGGSPAFLADAERHGYYRPVVVAHQAVGARLDRYRMTEGWNMAINARQFGWLRSGRMGIGAGPGRFLPEGVAYPDVTYEHRHVLSVGGTEFHLHHGRGETDDHTWAWIPSRRAICCGDFLIWNFPNAGNPQKVQRYPLEWAGALREMAALEPELLLPAHGLPIGGTERIRTVLVTVAEALEDLVGRTLEMMNSGATLDEVVHAVTVPAATLALPYLRPLYDEPEFVVRNVWRLYGGWWDANPARLKPPPDHRLAAEVAALSGGPEALAARAQELATAAQGPTRDGERYDLRLACQLVEWAAQAAPTDKAIQETRARIYEQRQAGETSLMAKGIFAGAAKESRESLAQEDHPGEG